MTHGVSMLQQARKLLHAKSVQKQAWNAVRKPAKPKKGKAHKHATKLYIL